MNNYDVIPSNGAIENISFDNNTHHELLSAITTSLGVARSVLPDEEEINYALKELPRELNRIPLQLRDEFIVRASIASSVGLFDAAIIYVWNTVIKELRKKVESFGFEMIKHIRGNKVEDNFLVTIKDSDLLTLCEQLNIITEQGYYFLDQCRDIRNNASAAHPSTIELDDRELINFISRCAKYGLSNNSEVTGVNFKIFNAVLESSTTTEDNLNALSEEVKNTFESQKNFIFTVLYSYYIDGSVPEIKRNNSMVLAKKIKTELNNTIILNLVEKHNEKKIKDDEISVNNSVVFLRELNLMSYLNESERAVIFRKGITNLKNAHLEMNNFYNEPPFAERLSEISYQIKPIPSVVKEEYMNILITCYFGNNYGVSDAALPFYTKMFQNLTPKELEYLLIILRDKQDTARLIRISWKKNLLNKLLQNILQNVNGHSTLVNIYTEIIKKYSLTI
ncbi:MAG: hypothetical protein ACFWTQ_04315 [Lactococcus sp.]|jgi:hypothetical protein